MNKLITFLFIFMALSFAQVQASPLSYNLTSSVDYTSQNNGSGAYLYQGMFNEDPIYFQDYFDTTGLSKIVTNLQNSGIDYTMDGSVSFYFYNPVPVTDTFTINGIPQNEYDSYTIQLYNNGDPFFSGLSNCASFNGRSPGQDYFSSTFNINASGQPFDVYNTTYHQWVYRNSINYQITPSGSMYLQKAVMNLTITPQVSAVPIPATAWLFGSGLLGLVGVGRRRRKAEEA